MTVTKSPTKRAVVASILIAGLAVAIGSAPLMRARAKHSADKALVESALRGDRVGVLAALKAGGSADSRLSSTRPISIRSLFADLFRKRETASPTALLAAAGWHDESRPAFQLTPENTAVVRTLVDGGASVNARDKNGDTALLISASSGHNLTFDFLLDHGANISAKDRLGASAWTLSRHDFHRLAVLLDHGQDINERDMYGRTALTWAAALDRPDIIRLLLSHHADVNLRDNDGNGPRYWAMLTLKLLTSKNSPVPDRYNKLRRAEQAISLLDHASARD